MGCLIHQCQDNWPIRFEPLTNGDVGGWFGTWLVSGFATTASDFRGFLVASKWVVTTAGDSRGSGAYLQLVVCVCTMWIAWSSRFGEFTPPSMVSSAFSTSWSSLSRYFFLQDAWSCSESPKPSSTHLIHVRKSSYFSHRQAHVVRTPSVIVEPQHLALKITEVKRAKVAGGNGLTPLLCKSSRHFSMLTNWLISKNCKFKITLLAGLIWTKDQ
jgi:hypothetical protein